MDKSKAYQQELEKLHKIFEEVDPNKAKLVEGLIQDAAFLKAENEELKEIIAKTGMIITHPKNINLQKGTKAGDQYLKNTNSYSVIIKTLNGVLMKSQIEGEDEFDIFLKEMNNNV